MAACFVWPNTHCLIEQWMFGPSKLENTVKKSLWMMTSLLVFSVIDPVVGSILNAGVRTGVLAVTAATATGQYDDKCCQKNE